MEEDGLEVLAPQTWDAMSMEVEGVGPVGHKSRAEFGNRALYSTLLQYLTTHISLACAAGDSRAISSSSLPTS